MRGSLLLGIVAFLWLGGDAVTAAASAKEDEPAKGSGVLERIGKTAQKVGDKIEQGVTKAGRKLKEKKVGDKIERKLKKAARKTAEGLKKAGDKIDRKLNN